MNLAQDYPEVGELVIATVKKIMPYGAFCSLDEYNTKECFIHVSQVSSGWVRNIREHLKEGQKIVAKVHNIDTVKNQIDLSLKQVAESDKKRKMDAYKTQIRYGKLLERIAVKLKKTPALAQKEAAQPLVEEFGDLVTAFEAIHEGKTVKIPKIWSEAIAETLSKEIKPKIVDLRKHFSLTCFDGSGVKTIIKLLEQVEANKKIKPKIHYLGAPNYYLYLQAGDFKTAEKNAAFLLDELAKSAKQSNCEFVLLKQ